MTVWHLDTCNCKLEISDEDASRGQIVGIVKACPIHSTNTHDEIAQENRNKNKVMRLVKTTFPGTTYKWAFGVNRRIEVTIDSQINTKQKTDINAQLEPFNGIVL